MSHPETLSHVLAKLEPDSGFDGCAHDPSYTPATRALISLAISARRIADALDGTTLGVDISESLAGLNGRNS